MNNKILRNITWLVVISLAPTGLGIAQLAAQSQTTVAQTPAPTADTVGVHDALRPGDMVRVRIWREPDLSGDYQVDDQGMVVLPKLGPMKVTDLSPTMVKSNIVTGYERFLAQTSIDVAVLRRVQVLGAVKNPGLYPMDATMTIADALAMAGGVTPDGDSKKIQLLRHGQKIESDVEMRTRVSDSPIRSGDQLYVPERSWLARNPYFAGAALAAFVSMIAIVTR